MFIIIEGGPMNYTYVGMFVSRSEAEAWATDHQLGHHWVVQLTDKATLK
jgi:hypothetical protein